MKRRLVFKALWAVNGKLESVSRNEFTRAYRLQYNKGQRIVPKLIGSKLFCFDTFESAKEFVLEQFGELDTRVHIYLALADNPTRPRILPDCLHVKEFWEKKPIPKNGRMDVPGTLFADALTLIYRVNNYGEYYDG